MNQEMFKQKHIQEKVISTEGHFQKKKRKKKTIKYSQATGNEVNMNIWTTKQKLRDHGHPTGNEMIIDIQQEMNTNTQN